MGFFFSFSNFLGIVELENFDWVMKTKRVFLVDGNDSQKCTKITTFAEKTLTPKQRGRKKKGKKERQIIMKTDTI